MEPVKYPVNNAKRTGKTSIGFLRDLIEGSIISNVSSQCPDLNINPAVEPSDSRKLANNKHVWRLYGTTVTPSVTRKTGNQGNTHPNM